MPRVRTEEVWHRVLDERRVVRFDLMVNKAGEFYCRVPESTLEYFVPHARLDGKGVRCEESRGVVTAYSSSIESLVAEVRHALEVCHRPEVERETVIRYNIESHVSFALDGEEVVPNSGWTESARWVEDGAYGKHHACAPARGGYSMTVGAVAMTKTTTRFGGREKVEYSRYYGGGGHLGRENSAQRLNSWCSFSLPEGCSEMPYSDSAAEWFFSLMTGMAKLSRMVQENTKDPERLAALVESGTSPLAITNHGEKKGERR